MRKIHTSIAYRLNNWVLDRYWSQSEMNLVARTTALECMTVKGTNLEHGVEYTPSSYLPLHWTFGILPSDHSDWSFIDIGSGRGRVVCTAARLPFKRVIGVEFAGELCREAHENLACMPREAIAAASVDILNEDAAEFSPPSGNCIFYLFNPFDRGVLEQFLNTLVESHDQEPRQFLVAYYNPVWSSAFERSQRFQRVPLPASSRMKFSLFAPHRLAVFRLV